MGKHALIFMVVIPKEGLAGGPSLGMTLTMKLYSAAFTDYIFYLMLYCYTYQSFFWCDNDKDRKARFPMTRLKFEISGSCIVNGTSLNEISACESEFNDCCNSP